jgi:hypothetical protein
MSSQLGYIGCQQRRHQEHQRYLNQEKWQITLFPMCSEDQEFILEAVHKAAVPEPTIYSANTSVLNNFLKASPIICIKFSNTKWFQHSFQLQKHSVLPIT